MWPKSFNISDPSCKTCNAAGTKSCLSCKSTTSLDKLFESDHSCVASCPSRTYELLETSVKRCRDCHSSCLSCDGATQTDCLTCDTTDLTSRWFTSDRKTCTQTCPTAFYQSDLSNYYCSACYTGCNNYVGPLQGDCILCFNDCLECPDDSVCTKCKSDFYLYQETAPSSNQFSQCVSGAGSGQFIQKTDTL